MKKSIVSLCVATILVPQLLVANTPTIKKSVEEYGQIYFIGKIASIQYIDTITYGMDFWYSRYKVTYDVERFWAQNSIETKMVTISYKKGNNVPYDNKIGDVCLTVAGKYAEAQHVEGLYRGDAVECWQSVNGYPAPADKEYGTWNAGKTIEYLRSNIGEGRVPAGASVVTSALNPQAEASSDSNSIVQLQSQVQSLTGLIDDLKAQINQSKSTDTQPPPHQCLTLSRTLSFGSRGADVVNLQTFLIQNGLLSADSGTGYFGSLTRSAVRMWQSQLNIVATGDELSTGWGAVGPRSRALLARCQ